jgi:hypothetical protein
VTKVKCFHITTERGSVFGVAAATRMEARAFFYERAARTFTDDVIRGSVVYAGLWTASYGTVLRYV